MDFKNVLLAIILSTVVLVVWATFFEPPPLERQSPDQEVTESNKDISSPTVENVEIIESATRKEIISKTNRIKIENNNIKGSLSLNGGVIDDIIFKNYNETLNGEDNVTFLNQKNSLKE